jgi:ketosteroid isomerase-like protein
MGNDLDPRADVVAELYRAFKAREWKRVGELFAEDAELAISGRNPIAGTFRGTADLVAALRRLVDDTDGSIGPVREDTWDICASADHVIFLEWLQAARKEKRARFYIYLVCAFENGRIVRAFAHFDDQYEFDELWAD